MKHSLRIFAFIATSAFAHAQTPTEKSFQDLYTREWNYRLAEFPEYKRGFGGEPQLGVMYARVAPADWQRRLKVLQGFQKVLLAIKPDGLSRADRINYHIFAHELQSQIDYIANGGYLLPFNSDNQFWNDYLQDAADRSCESIEICELWLNDLEKIAQVFADNTALLRAGLKQGFTQPAVVLKGRADSLESFLSISQDKKLLDKNPLLKPLQSLPNNGAGDAAGALRQRARQTLQMQVLPAWRTFQKFLTGEYLPSARQTVAATALPKGQAFYRAEVREYTTMDIDPGVVHARGLEEVARIRKEMQEILNGLNEKRDLKNYLDFLRSDPQFFARTPHELLAEAAYWSKKADGLLPRYFKTLPRQPYGVSPVPEEMAPNFSTGRYIGTTRDDRAGQYWVNTSKLPSRPLWALPALTLHEAVPGHHLQNAIAAEQGEQPEFRRFASFSAYTEGWALYAEYLGREMNFFETPQQKFGALVYEIWRASRLVVDTGIHVKGWTREQALQYMRDNTALSEHEINTEVDRYISWPGQALSYKLGEITMRSLRAEAERSLGPSFDLRAFHDLILALGSVPLFVLEEEVRRWVQEQSKP